MAIITADPQLVLQQLASGKVAAIPTETVYGLAACIAFPQAIKTIYQLKKRPLNHPLIVHVAADFDLSDIIENIPGYAQRIIDCFWPGPLTLVFRCRGDAISPLVTGGQDTVAIRCPSHPLAQQLLAALPAPFAAPSANSFGKISPTTANHVAESFPEEDFFILEGGRCAGGIESTIVSALDEERFSVLRAGLINEEELTAAVGQPVDNIQAMVRVSGTLAQHYQPDKPLYIAVNREQLQNFVSRHPKEAVYVLSFAKELLFSGNPGYQLPQEPQQLAYELYYQLRLADKSKATFIAIELPENTCAWQGIRERIIKAGQMII